MNTYNTDYLEHHGILGQKWGVRRYQNTDGTLTPEGKKRQQKEFAKYVVKKRSYRKRPNYDFELADKIKETAPSEKLEKMYKAHDKYVKLINRRHFSKEDEKTAFDEYAKARDEMVDDLVGKYGSKKIRYIESRYNTPVSEEVRYLAGGIANNYTREWEEEYQKKRDSFKTDEEKDRWQARVERTGKL